MLKYKKNYILNYNYIKYLILITRFTFINKYVSY